MATFVEPRSAWVLHLSWKFPMVFRVCLQIMEKTRGKKDNILGSCARVQLKKVSIPVIKPLGISNLKEFSLLETR